MVKSWPLAPCEDPSGLAIDQKNRRLFAGCGNKMMAVIHADTGKVITTVPIGPGVDANAFDPETQLAFSSNGGDGTLTVVHEDSPDKFTVAENAQTQKFARTMTLDTTNHDVYLVTAEIEEAPPAKEGERHAPQHEARHFYPAGAGKEVTPRLFQIFIGQRVGRVF